SPRAFISASRAVVTLRLLDDSALGGVWVDICRARFWPRYGATFAPDSARVRCLYQPHRLEVRTAALPLEQRPRHSIQSAAPAIDRALLRPSGRHGHDDRAPELSP